MKTIPVILAFSSMYIGAMAQSVWTEVPTPTNRNLKTIQFVSAEIGYVGGDSVLLKTVDGGATWSEMLLDSFPNSSWQGIDIFDMHWFSEGHGIIMSGVWGGGFQTVDGGLNWQLLELATNGFCQTTSLFFFDEDNGFAGGAGCFQGHIIDKFSNGTWVTTNDSENWNSQGWVSAIEFKNAQLGLAGTVDGILLRTTDGGSNWDTIPNVAGDSAITDFIFHADGSIRATHRNNQSFGIMISTDNGLTWDIDLETATFYYPKMNAAHINDNGTAFLGGIETNTNTEGVIVDNSGGFWNWNSVSKPINDIASHSDSITFLVGDEGAIYVNADLASVGIKEQPTINFNVYPNPATDAIQLTGLTETVIGHSIMDVSGRMVSESESSFSNGNTLDVSKLSRGSYFINIRTEKGSGVRRFVKQ